MQLLDNLVFWQWFIHVWVVIFVVGGLAGIAVGAGLIMNSARTLAFFNTINRWTSLRGAAKPFEVPRDTTRIVRKYMRVLAGIFVVGGAYSLYALVGQFNAEAIIFSLKLNKMHPLISSLILDGARWILIAGNLVAVAVGIMMAFFPAKVIAVEGRGGRWFSDEAIMEKGDKMHTPIDTWVTASPRAAGWIIAFGSVVVVVSAAFMLLSQR